MSVIEISPQPPSGRDSDVRGGGTSSTQSSNIFHQNHPWLRFLACDGTYFGRALLCVSICCEMLRLQQPDNRLGNYDMEYRLKFTVFSDDAGGQDTFAANLDEKQTYGAAISLIFRL